MKNLRFLFLILFSTTVFSQGIIPQGNATSVVKNPGGYWSEKWQKIPVTDDATATPNMPNTGKIRFNPNTGTFQVHNGALWLDMTSSTDMLVKKAASPVFGIDGLLTYIGSENIERTATFYIKTNQILTNGGGHGIADYNTISQTSGGDASSAYASIDLLPIMSGSGDFNHFIGIQNRPTFTGSGNITSYFAGATVSPIHNGSGIVDRMMGLYVFEPLGTGSSNNNYGIYISDYPNTSSSYAIWTNQGKVRFGGDAYFNGDSGFGNSNPLAKLHVTGGATMTGGYNRTTMLDAAYPVLVFKSGSKYMGAGYDGTNSTTGFNVWINSSSNDVTTGTSVFAIKNDGTAIFTNELTVPNAIASTSAVNKSQLDLKASIASPTFTGDPKAPTPTLGDNDTSISTTAFTLSTVVAQTLNNSLDTFNGNVITNTTLTSPNSWFNGSVYNSTLTLRANATAGIVTITLPSAASMEGRTLCVVKSDSSGNAVVISGGSTNINGSTSYNLTGQYQNVTIKSIGGQFYLFN